MTSDRGTHVIQVGEATVPRGPEAAALARTMVSRWLDGHAEPELVADARLLVSELVTNSIRHSDDSAGMPVHIAVTALDGVVRVEVTDHGHGHVRRRAPQLGGGGYGLHLVELIAARWGVEDSNGTHVWFELTPREHAWPGP
jgi:anti-sigma regulatory factor (Ser/Thr protein kinase)